MPKLRDHFVQKLSCKHTETHTKLPALHVNNKVVTNHTLSKTQVVFYPLRGDVQCTHSASNSSAYSIICEIKNANYLHANQLCIECNQKSNSDIYEVTSVSILTE